ncbi:SbmA/BacA-like family transporter [Bradyrhizobium sp. C9]|uniref:SbmA/BacA-like family transporter n=1 Tax=Bradyrhizobium sp. C9 TaxID=142585 RepID=UPI000BE81094|nr:SbmA/BacA-like family transporter [Bradyrhizobium sp. C9]PDT75014.1 ABC transporter [Bradyrhizobium sp. C9]
MSENSTGNPHQEWLRFWQSASGFWRGLAAWRVWLFCALLVVIVVLQLYVQFRFNYWNRDFFNALESRSPDRLRTQALLLVPLCGASIVLAVASVWGRMTVQRKWREWLTTHLIDYWVENERYARLAQVQGEHKIPEYRIAEDARIATDAPIDFALGLVSSLLTAIIFIQILWNVGGEAAFSVFDYRLWIPGYLVVSVVVYSGIVTMAMLLVGSPLTRVIQIKDQAEAELITAAHLLRDIGEGVTQKGEEAEVKVKRGLRQALQDAMMQWRRLRWQLMRTTLVSHGNSLLAPIIGLVLCAPKFLADAMTLGELTQAAAAFTLVQGSFNWLVDNYSRVADWVSSLERVGGLLLSLDQLNHEVSPADREKTVSPVGSVRRF